MKTSKIKIWHFVLVLWFILLIIRFNLLVETAQLIWYSIRLLYEDYNFISSHLNFVMVDTFLTLVIMITIPILISIRKLRNKILNSGLNFSKSFVVILIYSFLVPSLITRVHPEFQKNISEIKLLHPFSIIYVIELKTENPSSLASVKEKFLDLKERVLLKEFDANKIFIKEYSLENHSYVMNKNGNKTFVPSDSVKLIKSDIVFLGTDEFGRDNFSRLIFGARISIFIGFMAVIISLLFGLTLGYIASAGNSFISISLNRLNDLFLSFPAIFLVILILALFGNNLMSVILVLGLSGWMSLFKIVSSEVASIKQKDFFISSKRLGLNNSELLFKEILPVIMIPVTVNIVFLFSNVIIAESALSFLGLGAGNQYPSWGAMIEKGQEYIFDAWWLLFIPGIVLVLTLLSFHNIAKEVNKFFNPKIS